MADKNNGVLIEEFEGLRSKMCDKISAKLKGVKKYVVKNRISFKDYFFICLLKKSMYNTEFNYEYEA